MHDHEHYMRHCLTLAQEALAGGNPPVGSVVVRDGVIVGQGREAGKTKGDITCHAEIEAIRDAIQHTGNGDLSDCSLYTTHEPCLMCSYVLRHHAIKHVIMGVRVKAVGGVSSRYPLLTDPDFEIWAAPPVIVEGICSDDCAALSQRYARLRKGR